MEFIFKGIEVIFNEMKDGMIDITIRKKGDFQKSFESLHDENLPNTEFWHDDVVEILSKSNFSKVRNGSLNSDGVLSTLTSRDFLIIDLLPNQRKNLIKLLHMFSEDESMRDIFIDILISRVDRENVDDVLVREVLCPFYDILKKFTCS